MLLGSRRYEEIKIEIADFLEDYGVKKLPVDVFNLAKKMKIKIVLASEILEKNSEKIDQFALLNYPDSFVHYDTANQKFIIYIDDIGCKKQRQRFSLAHEIMHIILGHTEQNEVNEAEANFGATYLLAPTSLALVRIENSPLFIPELVEQIFDVSAPEAKIIARYNANRVSSCDLNEKSYEKTINRLLGDSLIDRISAFH